MLETFNWGGQNPAYSDWSFAVKYFGIITVHPSKPMVTLCFKLLKWLQTLKNCKLYSFKFVCSLNSEVNLTFPSSAGQMSLHYINWQVRVHQTGSCPKCPIPLLLLSVSYHCSVSFTFFCHKNTTGVGNWCPLASHSDKIGLRRLKQGGVWLWSSISIIDLSGGGLEQQYAWVLKFTYLSKVKTTSFFLFSLVGYHRFQNIFYFFTA